MCIVSISDLILQFCERKMAKTEACMTSTYVHAVLTKKKKKQDKIPSYSYHTTEQPAHFRIKHLEKTSVYFLFQGRRKGEGGES